MHIRKSTVKRNGKTYRYLQLVQSYRRKDGIPTQRVLASLNHASELEIENLKLTLKASREGKRVIVARIPKAARPAKPLQNLEYLHVAVLRELWQQWGLDEVLAPLFPQGSADVFPLDVLCSLAIQRCVAPGSDLFATRWFPRTALPELLRISPKQFNNTRVHRTLKATTEVESDLMRKLSRLYGKKQGAFASLFIDVTDTWFVGRGPEIATKGKTKEGRVERKIGIVLMCNEHGFPVRWDVVEGNSHDSKPMLQMLRSVQGLSWIAGVPLVADRAMGKTAHINDLLATGIHFLTALTRQEFDTYSRAIPHQGFATFDLPDKDDWHAETRAVQELSRRAQAAGMEKVAEDLLVLDLGLILRPKQNANHSRQSTPLCDGRDRPGQALRAARTIVDWVQDGRHPTYVAAARELGIKKSTGAGYRKLLRLPEDIQRRIIAGETAGYSLDVLLRIAAKPDAAEQREEFADFLARPPSGRKTQTPNPIKSAPDTDPLPDELRGVVCFNPTLFIDQRRKAQEQLAKIAADLKSFNESLASLRSRRDRDSIVAFIDRMLRPASLLGVFELEITTRRVAGTLRYQANLKLNQQEWELRRRHDGFFFLVGHPEIQGTGAYLAGLYRAKDAVEKDFGILKGLTELRPFHHHEYDKVRAHVTVCMLALLLERSLKRRLGSSCSTGSAIEELATCRLNRYPAEPGESPAYLLNITNEEQDRILRTLRLQHLADDDEIMDRIFPRQT